jgi:thiamine pyrophosphate-dependent acetolactate synthase large subunit-like protein
MKRQHVSTFMATMMSHLTMKVGLCFLTLGPSALNLAIVVVYAQLARFPMVTISNLLLVLFNHIIIESCIH